jgi:hypothetical protein
MPKTAVILYCEDDGSCPFLEWLDELPVRAQAKCLLRVDRLRELGHELRRPEVDLLRDGIYELRASLQGVNYRILYFFHLVYAQLKRLRDSGRATNHLVTPETLG